MTERPKKDGAGAPTPNPATIALQATAKTSYIAQQVRCNQNERWLLVRRSVLEDFIDQAIGWLDLTDTWEEQKASKAEAPENAL